MQASRLSFLTSSDKNLKSVINWDHIVAEHAVDGIQTAVTRSVESLKPECSAFDSPTAAFESIKDMLV